MRRNSLILIAWVAATVLGGISLGLLLKPRPAEIPPTAVDNVSVSVRPLPSVLPTGLGASGAAAQLVPGVSAIYYQATAPSGSLAPGFSDYGTTQGTPIGSGLPQGQLGTDPLL